MVIILFCQNYLKRKFTEEQNTRKKEEEMFLNYKIYFLRLQHECDIIIQQIVRALNLHFSLFLLFVC